ncbi:MAG TPA: hypothetical protein VK973_17895 [Arenicellales bacterium]|nr:hypothetical protein [Arenicellales bacterium]
MDWTVRELTAYAAGQSRRHDSDMRLAMWAAWHAASFQRAKRIPPLERLMRKIGRRKPARKSPQQLLRVAEQITALFGGTDKSKR